MSHCDVTHRLDFADILMHVTRVAFAQGCMDSLHCLELAGYANLIAFAWVRIIETFQSQSTVRLA